MHNYRGFKHTLINLLRANFLVGENSTGKSSFLKLLRIVYTHQFWFYADFYQDMDHELGGFNDIVSAWAIDKSYFQIGYVTTNDNSQGKIELRFSLLTFGEKDGAPKLKGYIKLMDGELISLVFEKSKTKYKISPWNNVFDDEQAATDHFNGFAANLNKSEIGFKNFPTGMPPNPPIPYAISMLQKMQGNKNKSRGAEIPALDDLCWIAPIRTKPRRIYDGTKVKFTPEGDHTPFELRRSLRSRSKNRRFAEQLIEFGKTSGLFETVTAHSFGAKPHTPFELLVKFPGASLNINNVGYGVSQVLPLIVEFLSGQKKRSFAVQQPEVHLHPKAQAALGSLIYELAHQSNGIYVETHSDYLVDRFRLAIKRSRKPLQSQVLFFSRTNSGNAVQSIRILEDGKYPHDQPKEFRDFFIKEEIDLLDI